MRPTVWVILERAFGEGFALALFAIQAPILGPAAFGLVAAAMVLVYFWEAVPAMALTEALLSVRKIEDTHYNAATTAAVLACLGFGGAMFAGAGPLAALFGAAELAPILRVMALLPLIQAFSITPVAAAQRAMQFQTMTLRTTISLVAGAAVGLVLTLTGAGVWALVWQQLVQRVVADVVLWYAVPAPLRPSLAWRHLRELAGFASPVMLAKLMSWASGQLPRFILGMYMGPAKLGLFALATRLNALVSLIAIEPKMRVARVDLCRHVGRPEAMLQAVQRVFLQMGIMAFPISIGGAVLAPTLFHAWLDPRWYDAIGPAQLMLLSCVPYVTYYGSTALLYAANLQSWEAAIATVLNLSLLVGLVVSARFGLVAATATMAVIPVLVLPLPFLVIRRKCGLPVSGLLAPQVLPLLAACATGAVVLLLRPRVEAHLPAAAALLLLSGAGAVLYALLLAGLMPTKTTRFVAYLRSRT